MTWRNFYVKQQILSAYNGRRSRSGVLGVWISSVGSQAGIRYCMKYVLTQFFFVPRTTLQRHSSLHSFPNTLTRITFTHTNYFPLSELQRQASRYLVPRLRGGSHSVK